MRNTDGTHQIHTVRPLCQAAGSGSDTMANAHLRSSCLFLRRLVGIPGESGLHKKSQQLINTGDGSTTDHFRSAADRAKQSLDPVLVLAQVAAPQMLGRSALGQSPSETLRPWIPPLLYSGATTLRSVRTWYGAWHITLTVPCSTAKLQ